MLGAWFVAQHALPLPAAAGSPVAAAAGWRAWHVLSAECGCSAAVADSLLARGARPGWDETVLVVGGDSAFAEKLRGAGFRVEAGDPDALAATHGVQGAPWLLLFAPAGRPAYSGGYAPTRPGLPGTRDGSADLMAAVRAGGTVAPLPAYGCATSAALRRRLDPAGLRFSTRP